jgi:hypothetical protein
MAIMANGRIVAQGRPGDLTAALSDKIWGKTVDKDEVASQRAQHEVISTRLFAGRTVLHVYSESDPGDGMEPVEASLEDVYFHTLSRTKSAASAEADA